MSSAIGYARVSKNDQKTAAQNEDLRAAGVARALGPDPGSWTRCRFGYAASARVADLVAS